MSLRDKIERGQAAARQGVEVVSAPDLYPTPAAVAARVADYAELFDCCTVLEPSAGTGALVRAVKDAKPSAWITPVERSYALANGAERAAVIHIDFMELTPAIMPDNVPSYFDRIVMNPPFSKGADIKHALHARQFLCARGVLVAIVADGPRQAAAFGDWEDLERLPSGTFAGTGVRSRIIRWRVPQ